MLLMIIIVKQTRSKTTKAHTERLKMLYIGTSGFSYKDWIDTYYSKDLKSNEYLPYYAKDFDCTEINSTYYRLPDEHFIDSLQKKVPDHFKFVIKSFKGITHELSKETPDHIDKFIKSLTPMQDTGKMGGVLIQFPFSFHHERKNVNYLKLLFEKFHSIHTVIEFRNIHWLKDEILSLLKENDIAFCCVDQPELKGLLPSKIFITSEKLGYLRFHGRNKEKWWEYKESWERYDYLYNEEELKEWIGKIKELESQTDETFVFFNNHYQGKAVKNAKQLKMMLSEENEI